MISLASGSGIRLSECVAVVPLIVVRRRQKVKKETRLSRCDTIRQGQSDGSVASACSGIEPILDEEPSAMYEETLRKVSLFSGLNDKELKEIAGSAQERRYSAGAALFHQGDTGTGLYIITAGRVRIVQANDPDRAEEVIGTAGPGEVLGEMALLDDLPRSASVIAEEETTAILLPIWEFRAVLRRQPEIALKLLSVLSRRLRKAEGRLAER